MDYVSLSCCLLAFLLYYNTLDAGFVYDDRRAILSNQDLLPTTPWSSLLENDFWGTPLTDSGSHGSYRPLCVLTFRLNYFLGGFQPWGYHLVNVLLHVLATGLLVRVSRLVLPRSRHPLGPAVAGLLFAAHPVHTEAVAGVVGRADLAACNLYLLAFLAYAAHVRYRDNPCVCKVHVVRNGVGKHHHKLAHQRYAAPGGCARDSLGCGYKGVCWRNFWMQSVSLLGCVVMAAAALLTKETGVTVLGVCVLYDLAYGSAFKLNKKQIRSVVILGAAGLLMLFLRLRATAGNLTLFSTADNPTARAPCIVTRFLTFLYLPVFNFRLLIFPNTLSFDWGMEAIPRITSIYDPRNFMTAFFYGVFYLSVKLCVDRIRAKRVQHKKVKLSKQDAFKSTSGTSNALVLCPCPVCHQRLSEQHSVSCRTSNNNNNMYSLTNCVCGPARTHPVGAAVVMEDKKKVCAAVAVALAFLALPFLPATNLFFYVGFVVAERVLYLPSAGLCLLIGLGVSRMGFRRTKEPLYAILALVILVFCARTVIRNKDWFNEESLYRSAIHVNPPKAYGNLGSVLSSQGRASEAEWAFRKALDHRPNMADVHYNLGVLLQGKQQLEEAILSFQRAIHFRPSLALAYVNLGSALAAAGRCQEAVSVLRQGSRLDGAGLRDRREHESARVSALLQLGALYSEQGRLQRALAAYREAAHSLPKNYPPQRVYNVLGETLARLQQFGEAERWFQAALQAQPSHVPAHITYGKLLAKNMSRGAEAEQWFIRAQRLAPEDPSVYHHYGEFLASRGRHREAAGLYERAAELRPQDFELAAATATAMRQAGRNSDAERWYRRAVTLRPQDPRGHTNLGAILHLNGKYSQAADSYREALRLQPDDVTTLTNLHRLHTVMATHR